MLTGRQLIAAAGLSILLYVLTFMLLVEKPISVGVRSAYLDHKIEYLALHADKRKIVILAGSNGRFSHRCETIERETGLPCANMSITAGFNLPWQLQLYDQYLLPGDVLYLPIEYRKRADERAPVGDEAPYIMAYAQSTLPSLGVRGALHTLFYFDLRFLLSAIGEMGLAAAGVQSRFGVETMTAQGDERGHDDERAQAYETFVTSTPAPTVEAAGYTSEAYWQDVIEILEWGSRTGVLVTGGLPTVFEDIQLPREVIPFLRSLFESRGACFVQLPNRSMYPRDHFYDAAFHLRERYQIRHSRLLAPLLAEIAETGRCPADALSSPSQTSRNFDP
jgi:hypothetical protein